jgi:hypothetical protein
MLPSCTSDHSRTIEILTPKELEKIQKRMRPNKWSEVGFLNETESLTEVAAKDRFTLEKLGITFELIAQALKYLIKKADVLDACGESRVALIGKYLVKINQSKGYQICPFTPSGKHGEDCGKYKGSAVYEITRVDTKEKLIVASLMGHLILDHHFFQGGFFRIDPEIAFFFFDLKNVSYLNYGLNLDDKLLRVTTVVFNNALKTIVISDKGKKSVGNSHSKEEIKLMDVKTLADNNLTYKQLADCLESIAEKSLKLAKPKYRGYVLTNKDSLPLINGKYIVQALLEPHDIECVCGLKKEHITFKVIDWETKEQLVFLSLVAHIIRDHESCLKGGNRVAPEKIIKFFDLKTDEDYSHKKEIKNYWKQDDYCYDSKVREDDLEYVKKVSSEQIILFPDVTAYLIKGEDALKYDHAEKARRGLPKKPLTQMKKDKTYLFVANCSRDDVDFEEEPKEIMGFGINSLILPGSAFFEAKEKQIAVLGPNDQLIQTHQVVFTDYGVIKC